MARRQRESRPAEVSGEYIIRFAATRKLGPVLVGLLLPLTLFRAGTASALAPEKPISQFSHEVWQTENGLPQNTVHAVLQTRDGYVWVGTEEGLARFDGIRFTVFDKQNTPQLKSNYIRSLLEDGDGALWVGTAEGLVRFAAGKFEAFNTGEGLDGGNVEFTYADRAGTLWVATASGLSRFRQGTFAKLDGLEGLDKGNVETLFEDTEGVLWFGTSDGLSSLKDGKLSTFTTQDGLADNDVAAIAQGADGRLWLGTPNGLTCLQGGTFKTYTAADGLPSDRISSLYADKEGSLWVGTSEGLSRFRDGRFTTYDAKDGLSSNIILSIFEDGEGSLWVGTESGGLNLLKDKKFTTYTSKDGLSSDLVKAIYEDREGGLWVGTYGGGLDLLKDGKFTVYTSKDGLSSNIISALSEDGAGNLWVGTPDGLNRFSGGKFNVYTSADGLSNDFVRSLYEDRRGNLWIGTRGGLTRLRDGVFTIYTTEDGLPNDFIGTIQEDAKGSLWIGTLGGLSRLTDDKFTVYTTREGLSSDVVLSLYEDRGSDLWIGTNGGGLNRLRDGKFTAYTTRDGLFDDVVYRVLEDAQDNLWLSCNKGIFRVAKKELDDFADKRIASVNSVAYGTADGMLTRECSGGGHPAGWRGRDGRLWFPTIKGVAMIDPARIKINSQPPPVVIERINVDDESILPGQQVELSPGKTRFDFYYTGLSFVAPEKVRFKYRLEGFDKDWVDGGDRRVAYYTNLPPGAYRFRVIASNNDGVWNQAGASFAFYLKPLYYQTYWFYVLCVLALALLAWQLYRFRVRRIEGQFAAVLAERNRIAREIHDNLAQEILGISVQLEVVARTMGVSAETAGAHLDRARILVRNSIAEARRYVWDLRSQALEKNDLPAALSDTARRLTAETSVQAQVQVSGTFRPLTTDKENNLLRIGQEAVNNAVKHAGAGRILIHLKFDHRRVQLSVRDDGRGFDPAGQEASGRGHFGLLGMRERAAQIGGTLHIHSAPDEGTEVVVDVPTEG
jgi:ligand-binding sensor domain-containing protein/signal transduction histidine kinase